MYKTLFNKYIVTELQPLQPPQGPQNANKTAYITYSENIHLLHRSDHY